MDERGLFLAELLTRTAKGYAAGALQRQRDLQPELARRHEGAAFLDMASDTVTRIGYLAEAVAAARPRLFTAHVEWLQAAYAGRGLPAELLVANLQSLRAELHEHLPGEHWPTVAAVLDEGLQVLQRPPALPVSALEGDAPHIDLARNYLLAILEGRATDALRLIEAALDGGVPPSELREQVVVAVQTEIGQMWQVGEIHVGEEHFASRVTERALARIAAREPRAASNGHSLLLTSIGGDLHDLGLRILADRFEASGWNVIYLGASMPGIDVMRTIRDYQPDVLGIGCQLELFVRETARLIKSLRAVEIGRTLPVLVGGKPFNEVDDLWQVVGADASAASAEAAVAAATRLLGTE